MSESTVFCCGCGCVVSVGAIEPMLAPVCCAASRALSSAMRSTCFSILQFHQANRHGQSNDSKGPYSASLASRDCLAISRDRCADALLFACRERGVIQSCKRRRCEACVQTCLLACVDGAELRASSWLWGDVVSLTSGCVSESSSSCWAALIVCRGACWFVRVTMPKHTRSRQGVSASARLHGRWGCRRVRP